MKSDLHAASVAQPEMPDAAIRRTLLVLALAGFVLPGPIAAQDFLSKPIRLMVGFAPGGSSDFVARLIAPRLGEALSTTVVVDNKLGASGTINSDYVAKSTADGYTLMLGGASAVVIASQTIPKVPFNPLRQQARICPGSAPRTGSGCSRQRRHRKP